MPEMHSRQLGFKHSACGPFTKNKVKIQNFRETGDARYICQNESDKACFEHGMTYGDFKDLTGGVASYKALLDKAFNIVENPKYDGDQFGLASMVCKFFDDASAGTSHRHRK